MYIPKHFNSNDREKLIAFMQRFNFATIVSVSEGKPLATHLPFVVEREDDEIVLYSHFARANPQWETLKEQDILVVFTEPHAYISPKHYDKKESVPTWNYIAVHAYGKAEIIKEEDVLDLMEKSIDQFDPNYRKQWENITMDYKVKLAKGTVGFKMKVTDLQAKEKLSQNKSENERSKIIDSFAKSEFENERLIADYMKKTQT